MNKFYKILTLFVFLYYAAFAVHAQNLGFSLKKDQKKVQIPFELYNNLIVIPVILNGTLPLRFVLDTGVRTTILTEKAYSDILNLVYTKKISIAGAGGMRIVEAYVTGNVSLDIPPGVIGRGHVMLVLAEDYLQLRNYLGTNVHGIVGYELFSRFIVKIDYAKRLITLNAPHDFKPKRSYRKVDMTIEDTKPYIQSQVTMHDGQKVLTKLLVDSGASHGLLLDPESDDRISVPEKFVASSIGRGLGGDIPGKIGRIQQLNINGYKLNNLIATFPDPDSYMDSVVNRTFRHGTVGGEILSRFHVIFDFSKQAVYLKKNSAFKKKFNFNMSGVVIKAKGSALHTYEVVEVRKNSSAANAGVLAGDIIREINGVNTKYYNLSEMIGILNSKEGKKIHLEILRDNVRIKARFRLLSPI